MLVWVSPRIYAAPGDVDTEVEANETFTVNLTGATNATITGGTGTGTIINDDACIYSISLTSLNIGAAGTG